MMEKCSKGHSGTIEALQDFFCFYWICFRVMLRRFYVKKLCAGKVPETEQESKTNHALGTMHDLGYCKEKG